MLAAMSDGEALTAAWIVVGIFAVMILAVAYYVVQRVKYQPCPNCKRMAPRGATVCGKCGRDIA